LRSRTERAAVKRHGWITRRRCPTNAIAHGRALAEALGHCPPARPSVGRGGRAAPEKLDSPVVVLRVPVTGAWVRPGMDQGIG